MPTPAWPVTPQPTTTRKKAHTTPPTQPPAQTPGAREPGTRVSTDYAHAIAEGHSRLAHGAYAQQSGIDLSMESIGAPSDTTPWPRRSSPASRKSCCAANDSPPASRRASGFSGTSNASTTPSGGTQASIASRVRTTTPQRSHRSLATRCQRKRANSMVDASGSIGRTGCAPSPSRGRAVATNCRLPLNSPHRGAMIVRPCGTTGPSCHSERERCTPLCAVVR